MAGAHLSRDFFDLIKSIGEAKSKQVRRCARARAACADFPLAALAPRA